MTLNDGARFEILAFNARQKWGNHPQMVKTIEECAELIQVLSKKINGSPTTLEAIVDEIADVIIMAEQMRLLFGEASVDQRITYKLDRLEKAISK